MKSLDRQRLLLGSAVFADIAAVLVVLLGTMALLGWAADVEFLKSLLHPGRIAMNPATALCFILAGIALGMSRESRRGGTRDAARIVLAAAVVLIAGMKLLNLSELSLAVDRILFRSRLGDNRMAPNTAVGFALIGTSLLLLDTRRIGMLRPATVLALLSVALSLLALTGYLYDVQALYQLRKYIGMALNTGLGLLLLSLGILCVRPQRQPLTTLVSATAGGTVGRRLAPIAIVVPLLLGWIVLRAERARLLASDVGFMLFALAIVAIFLSLIWWIATRLYRLDLERARAEARLAEKNQLLETTVRSEREAHDALKRAQSQLVQTEKLASLGQMVAGVAHEINNPLSYVSNNTAVLQRDLAALAKLLELYHKADPALAERQPELAGEIRSLAQRIDLAYTLPNLQELLTRSREGLRRIQQIVKDLRDFARLDQSDLQSADLNDGIRSTANIILGVARKRKVNVELALGTLPTLSCYPAKINQVVMNLLSNAIQASPEGSTVTVRSRVQGTAILIEVADQGTGIPASIRDRIFDPFFTTKPPGEGTGLGLSISYGIVQDHGGQITVESEEGKGSTFAVVLPAARE